MRFSRWFCLLLIALPVPAAAQATLEEFRKHLRGASFYCVMTFVLPIVGG